MNKVEQLGVVFAAGYIAGIHVRHSFTPGRCAGEQDQQCEDGRLHTDRRPARIVYGDEAAGVARA